MAGDTGVRARCACGAHFRVDDRELTSIQACPKCRASYHVVLKLDPQTQKKTATLVPRGPIAPKADRTRVWPAPPPAKPARSAPKKAEGPFEELVVETGAEGVPPAPGRDREASERRAAEEPAPEGGRARPLVKGGKAEAPAPDRAPQRGVPPQPPPGAQAVACPCGGHVMVRRRDLERTLPCPACGRELQFEEDRDPQTLAPRIRVRPGPAS